LIGITHANLNLTLYMPLAVSMLMARNELARFSLMGVARKYGNRATGFFPA
tara:strand:- start:373 stop:525 length:153 start_codon:yes stop_codon:yes gene_type:complete